MLKFYFSLTILWVVISTLNGMNSNILLHENDTIHISYVGQSTRIPVTLSSSTTMLKLSGLEIGMSYNIVINPGDIVTGSAEITYLDEKNENIPGKIIEFEATSELANLKLFTADIGELYYLSISEKVKENPGDPIVNNRNPPAITTNTAVTTNSLVQSILGCNCLTSSVAFSGNTNQRGTFANGTSSIGFGTGIILSTGNINVASGPNNNSLADGGYGNPGTDANLDALTGGNLFDVSKLEFDIIPSEDTISFEYVFASEEYCEYQGSIFNDVFGFFISGPGISGTQNLAVLPGVNSYVSVNNVNHNTNSAFYVGNIPPTGGASIQLSDNDCIGHPTTTAASTIDCQFDGYTTFLTAKRAVYPGQLYHIKVAIADVADGQYDSAVFIKSSDLTNNVNLVGSVVSSNPGNAIYEDCSNGSFKFTRQNGDINQPLTVTFEISPSSTATSDVDYIAFPLSITIPAGDSTYILQITLLPDSIQEGTETIILQLIPAATCQCLQVITMSILDSPNTFLTPTFYSVDPFCTGTSIPALPTVSNNGITGTWSPAINNSITTTYTFTPSEDQCANPTSMVISIYQPLTPTFNSVGPFCIGTSIPALPNVSNNGITGTWSPAINNSITTIYTFTPSEDQCANPTSMVISIYQPLTPTFNSVGSFCTGTSIPALPTVSNNGITGTWSPAINNSITTTYTFIPSGGQCATSTSIAITIDQPILPTFNSVSPFCSGTSIPALPTISNNGITGTWSPAINNITTTIYTFTPLPGQCATTTMLTISINAPVNPPPISPSQATVCSGQNIVLTASGGVSYLWNTGMNSASITVNPTQTTTYTVTVTNANGCTGTASRTVNLFSTPTVNISSDGIITSVDTINCGDVAQLQLNASLNAFPNIQWSPSTSISNLNIVNPFIYPCATTIYTATFTNTNGCSQSASVSIYVNNAPTMGNLSISTPSDTITLLDTLYLNVELNNINNLYSLYMKLKGDAAVSSYLTYAGYTAGTLLGTGGTIISTPPVVTSGVYDFGITKVGAVPGFSGNGIFYTFKFVTKNVTIPNNTQFCFYLDDISAYNSSGIQGGLINQSFFCYTFTDKLNVWPGDLNNSKTVTTADLLPIGYFYNSAGPSRANASIQRIAQPATLWGFGQASTSGSAYKTFADSNGDGVINNADQAAIGFNMGKIHAFWENLPDNLDRTVSDGDILVTASPSTINPADLPQIFNFEVTLQNTGGLSSLYGVSFNMLFDDEVFDLNTAYVDYSGTIFGNTGSDYINIEYNTDTTISIGLTRYANNSIKGNGKLCNIQLQTRPTFPGSINQTTIKTFVDAANTQAGDPLIIQSDDLIIDLENKTAVYDLGTNYVIVYPNPANDKFFIYFDELNVLSEGQQLMVYNYTGQKVFETEIDENPKAINTNLLGGSGFYTLVIKDYRDNVMEINKLIVK